MSPFSEFSSMFLEQLVYPGEAAFCISSTPVWKSHPTFLNTNQMYDDLGLIVDLGKDLKVPKIR